MHFSQLASNYQGVQYQAANYLAVQYQLDIIVPPTHLSPSRVFLCVLVCAHSCAAVALCWYSVVVLFVFIVDRANRNYYLFITDFAFLSVKVGVSTDTCDPCHAKMLYFH